MKKEQLLNVMSELLFLEVEQIQDITYITQESFLLWLKNKKKFLVSIKEINF